MKKGLIMLVVMLLVGINCPTGFAFTPYEKYVDVTWGTSVEQLQEKGYQLEFFEVQSQGQLSVYRVLNKTDKIGDLESNHIYFSFWKNRLIRIKAIFGEEDENYINRYYLLSLSLEEQYGKALVDVRLNNESKIAIWEMSQTTTQVTAYGNKVGNGMFPVGISSVYYEATDMMEELTNILKSTAIKAST